LFANLEKYRCQSLAIALAGLVLFCPRATTAQTRTPTPHTFNAFNLYWENDLFARTDRNYSNGIKLTWSTPLTALDGDGYLPNWSGQIMDRLPWLGATRSQRAVSLSLGQNIYTPEKTEREELLENDRPYAGYTYFGVGFHAKRGIRRHVWEVDIGVVGPLSLAEETQNNVHRLIDSALARGWEHQLKNEPTLDIITETKWRLVSGDIGGGWGFDLIPHLGGRLGNVAIYANGGAEVRFGWYLGEEFGSCAIRPGCETISAAESDALDEIRTRRSSFYLFLGVDGRAILRDIFLDGNTFVDSHSVDKNPFVADLIGGVAFRYKRARLSYAYIVRTPQFEGQPRAHIFGAINFSYSF
jgi:lipid A 3-O-deacylase